MTDMTADSGRHHDELRRTTDRLDIAHTVYGYAAGIDRRDWGAYRSVFADEVVIDFASYSGTPAARLAAEDWVSRCRALFDGLDATQHTFTNLRVEVDGDEATADIVMHAYHQLHRPGGEASYVLGGWYADRLIRTPDGWRISAVTLHVLWRQGDTTIMSEAARRAAVARDL